MQLWISQLSGPSWLNPWEHEAWIISNTWRGSWWHCATHAHGAFISMHAVVTDWLNNVRRQWGREAKLGEATAFENIGLSPAPERNGSEQLPLQLGWWSGPLECGERHSQCEPRWLQRLLGKGTEWHTLGSSESSDLEGAGERSGEESRKDEQIMREVTRDKLKQSHKRHLWELRIIHSLGRGRWPGSEVIRLSLLLPTTLISFEGDYLSSPHCQRTYELANMWPNSHLLHSLFQDFDAPLQWGLGVKMPGVHSFHGFGPDLTER